MARHGEPGQGKDPNGVNERMNMGTTFKRDWAIEAAFQRVEPKLKEFTGGHEITDEWLHRESGLTPFRLGDRDNGPHRMEARIISYYRAFHITVVRRGDRLRLLTAEETKEQSKKHKAKRTRQAAKQYETAVFALKNGLSNDLSTREAEHLRIKALAQLEADAKDDREYKAIIGAPTPLPRLKGVK
jgi:hypothetical protein